VALVGLAALFLATFLPFGSKGVVILLLAVAVMWGYSAPPLRLKSRPGLDLLTHAMFMHTFPYWMCLILIGAAWTALDYQILALTFLSSVTAQLEQQVRDFELDARTDTNFTTTFGLSTSVTLLKVGTLAGIFVFVLGTITRVLPVFLLPLGLIFLPGIVHRFLRRAEAPRSERLVTITHVVGILYIGLLLVSLVA
jgi:chlorophyll synthase